MTTSKYVVAVSGGVDSVVLLHKFVQHPELEVIVAHFDHGIRDDSHDDALFVEQLARIYGLPFETKREDLGRKASEEYARDRRYEFLRAVAKKHDARLVTAHHADDAIETVAINVTRGTGWRGLAVLDSDVMRPLLDMSKQEIIDYAHAHNLQWHEDSTNASDTYLRNRIRRKTSSMSADEKRQLLGLRAHQIASKKTIDAEVRKLVGDGPSYSRYFFIHAEISTALECLRLVSRARLTRPQLERALLAIKTNKAGSVYEAGAGVQFRFTPRNFTVELIK
jgi:tRNA(Ile)-lysidine synthase